MTHIPPAGMQLKIVSTSILAYLLSVSVCNAIELPDCSWVMPDCSEESIRSLITETATDPIEGIWTSSDDGARIAIISGTAPGSGRTLADSYLMVILDSPRPGILPGTVSGTCTPCGKPETYDCMMFTKCDGKRLHKPHRFTLHLADRSHITITEVHSGLKVVFGYSLPRINFLRIKSANDRPKDLDGFIRIWPQTGEPPARPRRL